MVEYEFRYCARCPQRFRFWQERPQVLCRDCRYVLGAVEAELWAA